MKIFYVFLLLLLNISCQDNSENYSVIILENEEINDEFLQKIKTPEKALLSWYLFAYGNECDENASKIKCQLLQKLNINDECNPTHLNYLLQWFSNDMLAVYKLNSCPSITKKSAIQNTFKHISLEKKADTLFIKYIVKGVNTIQEKAWSTSRTGAYLIKNNTFIKINNNE